MALFWLWVAIEPHRPWTSPSASTTNERTLPRPCAFCRLKAFRPSPYRNGKLAANFLTGVARCHCYIVLAPDKSGPLGIILDVEASYLALSKTENVSDRLVLKPMRLPLERFAFEIADGLPDFCDDRTIRSSVKAHRLDVRTDHGPLAGPVRAHGLAAIDVATFHTVGPHDIIGEHGQYAVYVPRVKAIVDALEEFDITIHWVSPFTVRVLP
jgi:hypothetical protein